jgi:hypothetical protein
MDHFDSDLYFLVDSGPFKKSTYWKQYIFSNVECSKLILSLWFVYILFFRNIMLRKEFANRMMILLTHKSESDILLQKTVSTHASTRSNNQLYSVTHEVLVLQSHQVLADSPYLYLNYCPP